MAAAASSTLACAAWSDSRAAVTTQWFMWSLSRPSEVLRAFGAFTMAPLEGAIHQPCLVLAGDADQYVPFERLGDVRRALANAAELDVRAFHEAEDPDMAQHCQIGDLDRAFAIMGEWLTLCK